MPNKNTFQTLGYFKDKRDDRLERFTHLPKGEKMYHRSKGIKTPMKETLTFKECPEYNLDNHTKVSSKTYKIRNNANDKVVNTIVTEIYKQTKTDKSRKVLHENLQNCDRLDISDLLTYQIELINDILLRIQELQVDQSTSNYRYNTPCVKNCGKYASEMPSNALHKPLSESILKSNNVVALNDRNGKIDILEIKELRKQYMTSSL